MSGEIRYGLCHCGCGEKTKLARYTSKTRGTVKGEPNRFIYGHQGRRTPFAYLEEDRGYDTPCWVWKRFIRPDGYGMVNVGGKVHSAHRYYWERVNGPAPDGYHVDHLCRVPACVNPDHLEAVTHGENLRRGNSTKLTEEIVLEIHATPEISITEWAKRLGVGYQCVRDIRAGKNWKHLFPKEKAA